MKSDGSQRQQNITGNNSFAINNLLSIRYSDDEASNVVFAGSVEVRHLGSFTSEQDAAVFTTTIRDALNDPGHNFRFQLSGSNVIEKEERARALHENIVYAVIDQIASDRVMSSSQKSDLDFCADAICRRD